MSLAAYLRNPVRLGRKLRWELLAAGPSHDVTVDTYNGRLTFRSADRIIGKRLFVQRAFERDYIERALGTLRADGYLGDGPPGTMVDIGANIGMICIALLRHGWFERALAVEPAPDNFRLLERNVRQNGLADRIVRVPVALSDAAGELALELSRTNSGDNRIRARRAPGAYGEERRAVVTVPVRTLDEVLADSGVRAEDVRLVWIDVQGHEAQCFRGARELLRRPIPVVSEFWPYGILRSGIGRAEYVAVARELFTHVYQLRADGVVKQPVAALDRLFDEYVAPKAMCEIILVRDR